MFMIFNCILHSIMTMIVTFVASSSWVSHYLLTGRKVAWCAWAYEHQHEPFWAAWVSTMDLLFGEDHCAQSHEHWQDFWKLYRSEDLSPD